MNASRHRLADAAALARHAVLIVTSALVVLPFVWMVSLSLKPPDEVFSSAWRLWPSTFYGVENYRAALSAVPLVRYLVNGVLVCAAIFTLQVLINLPCAYALAKLRFRGRDTLFGAVLVGLLIPPQVLAIPLFVLFYAVGIVDTYAALIVPWTVSVFGIFLMRQFFRTVPDELIHAARLDGLSELAIVWRVMLPVARPALVAFGIFSVVAHWNDLFWPLIVVQSEHIATPPLGALHFVNDEAGSNYGPLMAGTVLITLPLILVFLLAQRRFVDGITMTGMK
jgi:multiple sugar transport system permease protein